MFREVEGTGRREVHGESCRNQWRGPMIWLVNTKGLMHSELAHRQEKHYQGFLSCLSPKRAGRYSSADQLAWRNTIRHELGVGGVQLNNRRITIQKINKTPIF